MLFATFYNWKMLLYFVATQLTHMIVTIFSELIHLFREHSLNHVLAVWLVVLCMSAYCYIICRTETVFRYEFLANANNLTLHR